MLDFIATYWYVWFVIFLGCSGFVGYSHWKARQQKDFIMTGSALIGCIIMIFQSMGAISAILTIIAMVLKLVYWYLAN